jgi:hypothetical protein
MDELDNRGQLKVVPAGISAGACREDDQRGPQSLAPAADDVVRDLAYQHDVGIEPVTDDLVHRPQIRGDEFVD